MAITLDSGCTSTRLSLSEDGLTITSASSSWGASRTSRGVSSGKWYWECEVLDVAGTSKRVMLGVMNSTHSLANFVGSSAHGRAYFSSDGNKYNGNARYGESYGIGDVVGIALDMDVGTIEFFKNGVSQSAAFDNLLSLGEVFPAMSAIISGASVRANFGADKFCLVDTNTELWNGMVLKGYKPYDEDSAQYWFEKIKLSGLTFSQQYLDHKESGYICVSGKIHSVKDDIELSEPVSYLAELSGSTITDEGETPLAFNMLVDKDDLRVGRNILTIIIENMFGERYLYKYEINKEDKNTFTYKRPGLHDMSLPRSGDVIFEPDKGYVLNGMGSGRIELDIPTEGKSNINKITLDGTPEIREVVTKNYDMDLVHKEPLNPMTHFKKEISLKDLTVITKAELRR